MTLNVVDPSPPQMLPFSNPHHITHQTILPPFLLSQFPYLSPPYLFPHIQNRLPIHYKCILVVNAPPIPRSLIRVCLNNAAPGHPPVTPTDDLPIALRKGKRSCTAHPLAHSLSFHHLSPNYRAFSVSLSSVSIPNTYLEALRHPAWKMAMDDEMSALISRGTWELVEVTPDTDIVACRWVFTLKFRADGTLDRISPRCKGLHSNIWG
ncbi:UNVERIFIED_CONTAM: hypothetical protein Sangu_2605700 [Sesamum angustifolium]|uniref:Mitochondrial protein n=1 Tax=Sesamum angustifolium TaxID=2727405 RepID=A0AAW2J4T2_9LAMI